MIMLVIIISLKFAFDISRSRLIITLALVTSRLTHCLSKGGRTGSPHAQAFRRHTLTFRWEVRKGQGRESVSRSFPYISSLFPALVHPLSMRLLILSDLGQEASSAAPVHRSWGGEDSETGSVLTVLISRRQEAWPVGTFSHLSSTRQLSHVPALDITSGRCHC